MIAVATKAVTSKTITAEEFAELKDPIGGGILELVKGEIVEMPRPQPIHGYLCTRFGRIISNFVEDKKLGWVLGNDTGVILERDPDTVRGPDICFFGLEKMPELPSFYSEFPPDFVIEVRSPSDRPGQIRAKVRVYLNAGVRLIWVADPDSKSVMAYAGTNRGVEYDENDTLDGGEVLPGFTCKVAEFFGM